MMTKQELKQQYSDLSELCKAWDEQGNIGQSDKVYEIRKELVEEFINQREKEIMWAENELWLE